MVAVEPVPNEPAAVIDADERLLLIADYHAGFEIAMRYEQGVELPSRAPERKERLLGLVDDLMPDRLVVLGDLTHSIGEPGGAERAELEVLFEELSVPVTLAKGNHDGAIEGFLRRDQPPFDRVAITETGGARLGAVGIAHGHTWPAPDVLGAEVLCIGHEHPTVRLEDEVGGRRIERVWLRGRLLPEPFVEHLDTAIAAGPDLVVFPAFNELCGGTWVNIAEQGYLTPFLPDALAEGTVYLLDGTTLGRLDHLRT